MTKLRVSRQSRVARLSFHRFLGPVLVPRRYSRFLIAGCALGVAAILVVVSLFSNYYRAVEVQLLGVHPHLSIGRPDGSALGPRELGEIRSVVEELAGVVAAAPALDRSLRIRLASVTTHSCHCRGRGDTSTYFDFQAAGGSASIIDKTELRAATGFELDRAKSARVRLRGLHLEPGEEAVSTVELERVLDVRRPDLGLDRVAQGQSQKRPMAGYFERQLFQGASTYDDFLIISTPEVAEFGSAQIGGSFGLGESEPEQFRLLSTLHLGLRQGARPLLVTSLDNATRLSGLGANRFEIRLEEPGRAPELARALGRNLESLELEVAAWLDQDEGALRLLGVLRWVILVVASSIMLVAALGVLSTLSLVVMEGRSKIAMMRAMGLRDRPVFLALALECLRIAAVGLGSGTLLGLAGSWALLRVPGFVEGLAKMGITHPEVSLRPSDVAAVALATCILFLGVAWWPAREACRIDPVRGLGG